jgi:hypothetical protein
LAPRALTERARRAALLAVGWLRLASLAHPAGLRQPSAPRPPWPPRLLLRRQLEQQQQQQQQQAAAD